MWNKTFTPATFCIMFTKYPHKLSYVPHNVPEHKTQPEFVGKGAAIPNRPVCYKTSAQRGGLRSITWNQVLSRWEERFIWYELSSCTSHLTLNVSMAAAAPCTKKLTRHRIWHLGVPCHPVTPLPLWSEEQFPLGLSTPLTGTLHFEKATQ